MKLFKLKYTPLTIVVGFNFFTLILFYTAPIKWATDNLLLFLFFVVFCQLMIIVGYRVGYKRSFKANVSGAVLRGCPHKTLNFIFFFYAATFLVGYAYLLKLDVFDIQGMINLLLIGIVDPQAGYALSLSETNPATVKWSIYFLICIVNQVFFIVGFLKWKELNRSKKTVFILFLLMEVFFWMGRGTNFGVIRLITTLLFSSIYWLGSIKLNFTKKVRFYFIIMLLLIVSIYVFSYNINSRAGNVRMDFQAFNLGKSEVNENAAIFSIMPQGFQQTYLFMVSYLTQGYYHTSLAFDLDYKPTYLLGNNQALIVLAEVFKIDVYKDTYVYRLRKKGVDPLVNWHSAYLWYASDVSIFGAFSIIIFWIHIRI